MDFVSKQNHLLQLSVRSVSRFEALESWIISQFYLGKLSKRNKKIKYRRKQNATKKLENKTLFLSRSLHRARENRG